MSKQEWHFIGVSTYDDLIVSQIKENDPVKKIRKTLDRVSFKQKFGEIVGLIGSNDSGQESLVSLLLKESEPADGLITGHKGLAFFLTPKSIYLDRQTGRDYIKNMLIEHDISRKRIPQLIDEIATFSELYSNLDTSIQLYTLAQQAQLLSSIAIFMEPSILCLNNSSLCVSPLFFKKLMLALQELAGKGASIWLISEQPEKIVEYCDKLLWLEFGRVREHGQATQVLTHYRTYLVEIEKMSSTQQQTFWQKGYAEQLVQRVPTSITDKEKLPSRSKRTKGVSKQKSKIKIYRVASVVVVLTLVIGSIISELGYSVSDMTAIFHNDEGLMTNSSTTKHISLKESVPSSISHSNEAVQSSSSSELTTSSNIKVLPKTEQLAKADFFHEIEQGETLETIAALYGVSITDLKSVNQLTDEMIFAGKELSLPVTAVKQELVESSSSVSEALTESSIANDHTVVSGENLYQIAKKYGKDVLAFQQENGLQTPDLYPGQILRVPK